MKNAIIYCNQDSSSSPSDNLFECMFYALNTMNFYENLENEVIGYRGTLPLLEDLHNYRDLLPDKTVIYFDIYQKYFN